MIRTTTLFQRTLISSALGAALIVAPLGIVVVANDAWAGASLAQKCLAKKLTLAGVYSLCRSKAAAKAAKKGITADFSKCSDKFGVQWLLHEGKSLGECPTLGDMTVLNADIVNSVERIRGALELETPNPDDNTTLLQISGCFLGNVVLVNGPRFDVERLPGFSGGGEPQDTPGNATTHGFAFEYAGLDSGLLDNCYLDYLNSGTLRQVGRSQWCRQAIDLGDRDGRWR
jgi:hypothetical protein